MLIMINGNASEIPEGMSIQELLPVKGVSGKGIAVALNDKVIHAEEWENTKLKQGDHVEFIRHVGGG